LSPISYRSNSSDASGTVVIAYQYRARGIRQNQPLQLVVQWHTVAHLGGVDTQLENLTSLLKNHEERFRHRGLSITSEQRCAAVSRICITFSLLVSDGAGTLSTMRDTESDSDQLMSCSVIKALCGSILSFRSLAVVARVLIS